MISAENKVIREITFHSGINLIVDESEEQITGNNVGKTTVLKLVDFCLGADPKNIYVDPENKKDEYGLVKDFLLKKKVLITLVLKDDLENEDSAEIVIERNFLPKKETIRRINNQPFTAEEFEIELQRLLFPNHLSEKPTFRQIISHNIRYKDLSINNTLKTLDAYTSDAEYETLYLFLLGCDFSKGNTKQEIIVKINQEQTYKNRLEKQQTRTAYESALALIENEIEILNTKKTNLNLNENFEADLDKLNNIKYKINKTSSESSILNIRKDIIQEAEKDLNSNKSEIDAQQLKLIYQQATSQIDGIQKTFEDLVHFHNTMITEKVKFIKKELPSLEKEIQERKKYLTNLLSEEKSLISVISKNDSFEDLEILITELNEKFRKKGEYENIIEQLKEVEEDLKHLNKDLNEIDNELFSDDFEHLVKTQLQKFNQFFASISNYLYGEQYILKYDIVTNRKNQRLYKFSAFNTNLSSGKKQGEISCFDIAYTLFADSQNIPCLHFLLNDKKELMHDNQLIKIAELVNQNKIQFVASILKDKLPTELNNEDNFIVKLSQEHKLFGIENN